MYWDVKLVRPLPDYRLYVEIADGRRGVFDMRPYLDKPAFQTLKDPAYFNRIGIFMGALTWPDDQDIAPDTLLAELQTTEKAA